MNKQHTSGPWGIVPRTAPKGSLMIAAVNGLVACMEHSKTGCINYEQAEANASLIASAPELLACLQLMVVSFAPPSYELEDATDDYLLENFPEWFRARAAITKATGGEA